MYYLPLSSSDFLVSGPFVAFLLLAVYFFSGVGHFSEPTTAAANGKLSSQHGSRLPAGPKGLPIIGNLLQVLKARRNPKIGAAYLRSLKQYGDMTTLRMGESTWVLLNSDRVVHEIISKRANITHQRPHLPVASGLMSQYQGTILRQSNGWADGRRLMHRMLSGTVMKDYARIQESESMRLLVNYLQRPSAWYSHHYEFPYSIIHRIVAGDIAPRLGQQREEFARITKEFIRSINASLLDFFPTLTLLPKALQPGRRHWEKIGLNHRQVMESWWMSVKEELSRNPTARSFISEILLQDPKFAADGPEAMYLATAIIAAGSDNIRMTLNVMVMAALSYSAVFQKARAELDTICGIDNNLRLPCLEDLPQLPYISAMIKECLRWRPVLPLIPQHRLTQDLEFEGHFFPAGTDFVVNSLAVNDEFEDAATFKPERWLDGRVLSVTSGLWQFGGGRRICVGHALAHQELFLAFSRLIYCFDFAANGPIDDQLLNHSVSGEPFPAKVIVRSKVHGELITRLTQELEA